MQEIIIFGSIVMLAYLYYKYKEGITEELIIAFLISLVWVTQSGLYNYSDANFMFREINIFTLVCWTAGLVLAREVYEKSKVKNKFWKFAGLWVILVIIVEYIGYNYLDIQLASNYPGLFGLELMHVPWWGKIYYLTMGPIYLKLTDLLGVK